MERLYLDKSGVGLKSGKKEFEVEAESRTTSESK